MTERYLFADVEQPFHVWVKEGARWVLRDAAAGAPVAGAAVTKKPGAERGAAGAGSGPA